MQRTEAIKKLGKLLGKSLGYRVDTQAPTKDERTAAYEQFKAAAKERKTLEEKRNARRQEILAADAEYQALVAAHKEAKEHADKLGAVSRQYKFTVGTNSGMFFHVRAQGDTWEEIIDKVEAKRRT